MRFSTLAGILVIVTLSHFEIGCGPKAPKSDTELPAENDSLAQSAPHADSKGRRLQFALPPIECMLADSGRTGARITPHFFFTDPSLKAEIAQKQDAISRLLQFVLSTKRPAEVETDSLAAEFKRRLYPLLPPDKIADIAFDFDIFIRDAQ